MGKSYEREDMFGNKYIEHEDGSRSYQREDIFGNQYWEHQDGSHSYEREGVFGDRYQEHSDGSHSYHREGLLGDKYLEHEDGSRSYQREDIFGNQYQEHDDNERSTHASASKGFSGAPSSSRALGGVGSGDRCAEGLGGGIGTLALGIAAIFAIVMAPLVIAALVLNAFPSFPVWNLGIAIILAILSGYQLVLKQRHPNQFESQSWRRNRETDIVWIRWAGKIFGIPNCFWGIVILLGYSIDTLSGNLHSGLLPYLSAIVYFLLGWFLIWTGKHLSQVRRH